MEAGWNSKTGLCSLSVTPGKGVSGVLLGSVVQAGAKAAILAAVR